METLQALGRNDQNVARILFTQLVAAIGRNAEVLASKEVITKGTGLLHKINLTSRYM